MKPKATPVVRKILSLPLDLAEEVARYREEEAAPSEAEAIRRLIQIGLETERRRKMRGGPAR